VLYTDRKVATRSGRVRDLAEIAKASLRAVANPPEPVHWRPDDVTTLKFTSGSTGTPKALAATVASIDSSISAVQQMFEHGDGDDVFVFLPLSLLQQRYWIYSALVFGHDVTVSTYEAAFVTLPRARPTVVMGVPGFYATARRQIEAHAQKLPLTEAAHKVFGSRIRYLWTGSAPAAGDLLRFYRDAGLALFEGYGLNETCIATKNHPGAHRPGSVGRPLPGKRVLIGDDGVVSIASDHPVNTRYEYAADGDSERVFKPGGIVRTGDLGHVDEDGFLWIHGRGDDVIVLGNGRKVIVRPIEERLKEHPAIDEAVLFCATGTTLVAVVSPTTEAAEQPWLWERLSTHLTTTNAALEADEKVGRIVVARPFGEDADLLTSQFKPRRAQIFQAYRTQIDNSQEGIHA
jgi:long-chain acyl-CoA synthetase